MPHFPPPPKSSRRRERGGVSRRLAACAATLLAALALASPAVPARNLAADGGRPGPSEDGMTRGAVGDAGAAPAFERLDREAPAGAAAGSAGAGEWPDCVPSAPLVTFDGGVTVSMCFEHEREGAIERADALDFGLGSGKSALLYFFERDNAEVLVKVLDGCAINGHRWVFVAPVTTLAFNLRVDDPASGRSWTHGNPRGGGTAATASDLAAFPCAGTAVVGSSAAGLEVGAGGGAGPLPAARAPAGAGTADPFPASAPIRAGESATCVPVPVVTLDGGYTVRMCVEYDGDGETEARNMRDYGLDSRRSALLYAFERDNAEVLVKVLDGCAINGRRWVFVAPVTTLAFNLSIDPPGGGASWTHSNTFGRTAPARSDLSAFDCAAEPAPEPGGPNSYRARITGYSGDPEDVEALLTAEGVLRSATPDALGWFEFANLPAGEYAVKIHAKGHRTFPARLIRVPAGAAAEPFDLTRIPTDPFVYHWEEDQSTAGTEYSAAVNRPIEVELDGRPTAVVDHTAANQLRHAYNALLVDTDAARWTQEHAWRLLKTMRAIPRDERKPHVAQYLPPSRWLLTHRHLEGDIEVSRRGGETTVRLSTAAFVNAERRVARVEGKRGVWFSKRLHHALVRYVTDEGRDEDAYERIFRERFGVTTVVEDYAALTAGVTDEDASKFQKFHPREILALLNAFEEYPSGMHKTPGLDYLVRRLDGLPHPRYPQAGAVAWTRAGYVEFMEKGLRQGIDGMQRLVLHEKAHFLWEHVLDDKTKEDWTEIGGWYRTGRDEWRTTKQTEFVSAYAHAHNPNEDMAETISFFVLNPDKLRSRSAAKYEFVRDRIMQGSIYVSRIREDLTFTVYNLYPDYVFPGKVRRVDIRVEGAPHEDKRLTVEIELHAADRVLEGASRAETRVFSDAGTFFDLVLVPRDASGIWRGGVGTVLSASITLNRSAKAGYWIAKQIKIVDPAENERFAGAEDFGWKLYLENEEEDFVAPKYVPGTARLEHGRDVVEGRAVQMLHASWGVKEDGGMRSCWAFLNDEIATTFSHQNRGSHDAVTNECVVDFPMPEYMPSSRYTLNRIDMEDAAGNLGRAEFQEGGPGEQPPSVRLRTSDPDTEPPELDLNRIEVDAKPTNPEAPNGETIVTIRFRVRDNISGYQIAYLKLRDPQGATHFAFHTPPDYGSLFSARDPTQWTTLVHTHILPAGSAPGLWGLYEMDLRDRASNFVSHNFTEVVRFEVE